MTQRNYSTWPDASSYSSWEKTNSAWRRHLPKIRKAFSRKALRQICEAHETSFGDTFGMQTFGIDLPKPSGEDYYFFQDNGASVLAVAHLDTVVYHNERRCSFVNTEAGQVVFSGALDDRLGAYIILDLLPELGITYDILLTVGEESGQSTAAYFQTDKEYDWIIEFDRGGTDVVMYQYEDAEVAGMVRSVGARVSPGAFSDISYMEHLETKAFNWGVGYQDYHGDRSHAFLEDTFAMVAKYLEFHEKYEGVAMPHFIRQSTEKAWYLKELDDDKDWESAFTYGSAARDGAALDMIDAEVVEGVVDDEDFIENPTMEQINAVLDEMDGSEEAREAALERASHWLGAHDDH